MSDDEADPELLELLRKSLGISSEPKGISSETRVLSDAEYIYSNSIDVAIDMRGTQAAAEHIWKQMQQRTYSTHTWSEHELHPKEKNEETLNFVFTMDLLNFSFWSEQSDANRFRVSYQGKQWTGYSSLVACLHRALEEGIPITTPSFWIEARRVFEHVMITDLPTDAASTELTTPAIATPATDPVTDEVPENEHYASADNATREPSALTNKIDETSIESPQSADVSKSDDITMDGAATLPAEALGEDDVAVASHSATENATDLKPSKLNEDILRHVFRSETDEEIPLLTERLACLREAGSVLEESFDGSVAKLVGDAEGSAGLLVNLLAHYFSCYRDEARFEGRKVRLLKRAQIFVADLWAAFNGDSYGRFDDIDTITMFADYRIPQMLSSLGVLSYSPPLLNALRTKSIIESGHKWEIQLRGCSIWAVELVRQQILRHHPDATVNAILIDFFLYDLAKEQESAGVEAIPHHRTRSIWY